MIDVALFESVFNMLEAVVPEYDGAGVVREPSGQHRLPVSPPTNTYPCADGKYVIIGGNGDSIFQRLMRAAGRPDMAEDSRLANNAGRVEHEAEIDTAISAWTTTLDSSAVLATLEDAGVPCGPIYSVADMVEDPQFEARELFESVEYDGRTLKIPAITPKLSETPGRTEWAGPDVGAHTDEVLSDRLGLSDREITALRDEGIV